MTRYVLLCTALLVLAGSAAFAEPVATAPPPLFAVEQADPAAAPQCLEQEPLFEIKPRPTVSSCQGNACDKTSDCRPVGVPDCAQCWCIGPAGDKHCGCLS